MALSDLVASSAIRSVTVRSTVTPDVTVDPFAPAEEDRQVGAEAGPLGALFSILRPSIYVETPAGTVPIEPYGAPDANYMPLVLGVSALVAGTVLVFAFKGLRAALKKR